VFTESVPFCLDPTLSHIASAVGPEFFALPTLPVLFSVWPRVPPFLPLQRSSLGQGAHDTCPYVLRVFFPRNIPTLISFCERSVRPALPPISDLFYSSSASPLPRGCISELSSATTACICYAYRARCLSPILHLFLLYVTPFPPVQHSSKEVPSDAFILFRLTSAYLQVCKLTLPFSAIEVFCRLPLSITLAIFWIFRLVPQPFETAAPIYAPSSVPLARMPLKQPDSNRSPTPPEAPCWRFSHIVTQSTPHFSREHVYPLACPFPTPGRTFGEIAFSSFLSPPVRCQPPTSNAPHVFWYENHSSTNYIRGLKL